MLYLKEAVVVEGKYDRRRLAECIASPIVTTNGFRVFHDPEQRALIRRLAAARGLVILTDSDAAGMLIRQHLAGWVPPQQIKHAYAPCIVGKERRKAAPSKEGLLGVEGIDAAQLAAALRRAGATVLGEDSPPPAPWITKSRLYADGLIGGEGSAEKRRRLLERLGFPPYLSVNRLLEVLNAAVDETEYTACLNRLNEIE